MDEMNVTGVPDSEKPDLDMTERWLEAVILSLIAVTALVGNISLWFIITRSKRLRTYSNYFILCLSGADLLVSAVNMPVIVYTIVAGDWMFSSDACTALGFITMLTFVASVMSLGSISINRYIMICHPVKYKSIYTKRNTILFIAGAWLLSAALALPPLVGWASYGYLPGQSVCFCDWKTSISYTFFMVAVCFGGPCSVMTFCYIKILREVNSSKKRIQSSTVSCKASGKTNTSPVNNNEVDVTSVKMSDSESGNVSAPETSRIRTEQNDPSDQIMKLDDVSKTQLDRNPSYKKANNAYDSFKTPTKKVSKGGVFSPGSPLKLLKSSKKETTLDETMTHMARKKERRRQEELRLTTSFLVVIFCFIICWLPFCITMFYSVFSPTPVPRVPDMLTLLLGCWNSCCNPIIYGAMNRNFRQGFKRMYCCHWRRCFCLRNREDNTRSTSAMRSSST